MQKLIKLSDTHYIIVDDSEIKEGDWVIELLNKVIFQLKVDGNNYSDSTFKKITHSTKTLEEIIWWEKETRRSKLGFDKIKPLSLSEVEEVIYGYSVHNMAVKYCNNHYKQKDWEENYDNYCEGFKAHKELVKDKLFSVEDINNLLQICMESSVIGTSVFMKRKGKEFIQSLLPKTEWNIEFDEQGKIKLL